MYFIFLVSPEINNSSINHTVIKGDRIVLSCYASGCPAPEVTWKKIGSPAFHQTGDSITFESVVLSDHGEYVCTATAKGQTATKMGMLTVYCKYNRCV